MTRKIRLFTAGLGMVLLCGVTLAQEPVEDINPKYHPNLAQAQRLVVQANHYVAEAQKINNYDMKGHAEKARELLVQVNQELRAAATAANEANAAKQKKH
jgi:hypothetical protein